MIFSRNPVGQEEKRYKVPFPLAVLSAALHPANTLPCGTAKGYFCIVQGGRGEPGKALRKNLFHKQTGRTLNNWGTHTEHARKNWSVHSKIHQTSNYLQKNASKLVTNRFFYYLCTRTIKTEDYDSN